MVFTIKIQFFLQRLKQVLLIPYTGYFFVCIEFSISREKNIYFNFFFSWNKKKLFRRKRCRRWTLQCHGRLFSLCSIQYVKESMLLLQTISFKQSSSKASMVTCFYTISIYCGLGWPCLLHHDFTNSVGYLESKLRTR